MMAVKVVTVVLFLMACVLLWVYLRLNKAETENKKLKAENQQQAVEIKQKNVEVQHAGVGKKHHETVRRVSVSNVDEQLHAHGYFRDDDRLHGVRADLPKSSRYDADETSGAGSQSDL